MQSQKMKATGYYGVEGGVMPLLSCGSKPLASSFLTGDGSHMVLWALSSLIMHCLAVLGTVLVTGFF